MYEQRESPHPLVGCVWCAAGEHDGSVVDAANESWGLAFTRRGDGALAAELAGPAAEARRIEWTAGEEYWGADLASHVFWRGLDKPALIAAFDPLPVDGEFVILGGVRFPIPAPADFERLVEAMVAQGVLLGDELVRRALEGEDAALGDRALQRRFKRATGLGRKRIDQIARARRAYELLQRGATPADAAFEAGYADQAHLTRSLRVFAGQTPRQILRGEG